MYAPVAARLGVDRDIAKVAVLGAMYGQTTGRGAEALHGLETNYPVAMAYLSAAARAAEGGNDLRTRGGRLVRMGGNERPTGPDSGGPIAGRGAGPVRAQRDGAGRGRRVLQDVGGGRPGAARAARRRRAAIVLCLHDELRAPRPDRARCRGRPGPRRLAAGGGPPMAGRRRRTAGASSVASGPVRRRRQRDRPLVGRQVSRTQVSGRASISTSTSPMIFVAVCGGEWVATFGLGHFAGERLHGRRATHQHVTQRFAARSRIVEGIDGFGHVIGILGHRVHHGHRLFTTGRGRHRFAAIGVLLLLPFGQRLDVAALAGPDHPRLGCVRRSPLSAPRRAGSVTVGSCVVVVSTGCHGHGQRSIVMSDDVHARGVPVLSGSTPPRSCIGARHRRGRPPGNGRSWFDDDPATALQFRCQYRCGHVIQGDRRVRCDLCLRRPRRLRTFVRRRRPRRCYRRRHRALRSRVAR